MHMMPESQVGSSSPGAWQNAEISDACTVCAEMLLTHFTKNMPSPARPADGGSQQCPNTGTMSQTQDVLSPAPGAPSLIHPGHPRVLLSLFDSSAASPGHLCLLRPASLWLNYPDLAFATCSRGGPHSLTPGICPLQGGSCHVLGTSAGLGVAADVRYPDTFSASLWSNTRACK